GMKDIYGELTKDLSTPEKFDRYKEGLAARAIEDLKIWDSSPCRTCHKDPKPTSVSGQNSHMLLKEGRKTCVDCHRQLHYKPPR
ncbi:MAG: NapC/NirT family cytochrome c, partial [Deltaproteobacteria bacterium]|nr:NapC/NirT family cytochrome c [Deltaproteobacteria bacterium]